MIQNVGLFPHMTVAANIGTVPRLLGWPKERIRARTEELLELVGLEPRRREALSRRSSPAASVSGSASRARSPRIRR